jgi:hypothetical protein
MRQLSCMSADIYCQRRNNQSYAKMSYLYLNGTKGKQARHQRERERQRECVCERQRVAENTVGVCCKNGPWGVTNYFRLI